MFVREGFFPALLNSQLSIEGLFVKINLTKKKWLKYFSYKPNKYLVRNHLKNIENNLNSHLLNHDNFICLDDLNVEPAETIMKDFYQIYFTSEILSRIILTLNIWKTLNT